MVSKILPAMGATAESAPLVIQAPLPKAKVYVVFGYGALKKFFPEASGAPGQWLMPSGANAEILITYSPDYILRFGEVNDVVKKFKQEMWKSLKVVMQKVR